MKKKSFFRIISAFLILLSLVNISCSFFNEPVKDYFKEYTEKAQVIQYEISTKDVLIDSTGTLCVPS